MAAVPMFSRRPIASDFSACLSPWTPKAATSTEGCYEAYRLMATSYAPHDYDNTVRFVNNVNFPQVENHDPHIIPQAWLWNHEIWAAGHYQGDPVAPHRQIDGCEITVDICDPEVSSDWRRPYGRLQRELFASGREFLEVAGWLLNTCIGEEGTGFATRNLTNMISYLSNTADEWWAENHIWPTESLFAVIGMGKLGGLIHRRTWRSDPSVGGRIFTSLHRELVNLRKTNPRFARLANTVGRIGYSFSRLSRGVSSPQAWYRDWYGSP